MTDISTLLDSAFAKHQAGLVNEARRLYEQVLAIGDNAEAFHWLGILELQSDRHAEAVAWLRKAAQLEPANAQVLANLGNACFAASLLEEAAEAYRRSLTLNPASPETLASLGNLQLASEQSQQAIDSYTKALNVNPKLAEVWRGLATAFLNRGQHANALEAIERAERELVNAGQPVSLPIVLTKGNVLVGAGLAERALACFETVVSQAPAFAQARISLGGAHRILGDLATAAMHCEKAIALEPENPATYYALGLVHMDLGELELARESFERTLKLDPCHGRAHRLIASMTKHTSSHPDLLRMRKILSSEGLSKEQRTHLHFALGKALEDAALYDEAFVEISMANQLHRQETSYSADYDQQLMRRTAEVFSKDYLREHARTSALEPRFPKPVFVVGMPRSGTSLIEQILSSHPQVHGAGELDLLERCIDRAFDHSGTGVGGIERLKRLEDCDQKVYSAIGEDYASRIAKLAPGSRMVVDKMPANFMYVGVIRCALPHAVIIHAKRHPMATGWSIFKNYFGAQGHAYSFDQAELGRYYQWYRELMHHWGTVTGQSIHSVDYENLVSSQEAVSRRLLAHCGLEWDERCLEFHTNKRPVRTLSASQVRQPLYSDALDQWEHFAAKLKPLADALGEG